MCRLFVPLQHNVRKRPVWLPNKRKAMQRNLLLRRSKNSIWPNKMRPGHKLRKYCNVNERKRLLYNRQHTKLKEELQLTKQLV